MWNGGYEAWLIGPCTMDFDRYNRWKYYTESKATAMQQNSEATQSKTSDFQHKSDTEITFL